ncbi:unnamed protein product [Kuraishia capsulata CBS 1993]|uniref:t-SNARE coiled-coil homology domain-containing protein n=1 Tax=Kuraishia capsulata CBS 1993 TaxID=1382522 RepID=W6MTH8_9ASCO|nr:uncharacterized protein KUCA_T00005751001 [Kuraishia capsulata CBS 1993]CDK29758.1 unnamed protein product [Kuraishia capsulata CBS 1993]
MDGYRGDDNATFMNEVSKVKNGFENYKELIQLIDQRQSSLVTEFSSDRTQVLKQQINNLSSEASATQQKLKQEVKGLFKLAGTDETKQQHAKSCQNTFLGLIQEFLRVEDKYKQQNLNQAERRYRIVNPDASEQEVETFVNEMGSDQIFADALLTNRRGEATAVLQEVQTRQQEMQKAEKMAAELSRLFEDMQLLVVEQNEVIEAVGVSVKAAQKDIQSGIKNVDEAAISARKARRKKCWIFWIVVIILCVIIAAVVGGVVGSIKN